MTRIWVSVQKRLPLARPFGQREGWTLSDECDVIVVSPIAPINDRWSDGKTICRKVLRHVRLQGTWGRMEWIDEYGMHISYEPAEEWEKNKITRWQYMPAAPPLPEEVEDAKLCHF